MAIAQDASTPAHVTAATLADLTTASFTPPANSLVVAFASGGTANPGNGITATTTVSSSDAVTWTTLLLVTGSSASQYGVIRIACHYYTSSPGAITVTAANGGNAGSSGNVGWKLDCLVLTGASSTQTGATASNTITTATTAFTQSITTTTTSSRPYGTLVDGSLNDTFTANGNTSIVDVYSIGSPAFTTIDEFKSLSATGTPGAITLGATSSGTASGLVAIAEILPSNTVVNASPGLATVSAAAYTASVAVTANVSQASVTATAFNPTVFAGHFGFAGLATVSVGAFGPQETSKAAVAVTAYNPVIFRPPPALRLLMVDHENRTKIIPNEVRSAQIESG